MIEASEAHAKLVRKLVTRTLLSLLVLGLLLFGAAGRIDWWAAWVYLVFFAGVSFGGGLWLARHDPALLNERLGSLIQRDQKPWDKLFMVVAVALWLGWLVLMGLDAQRSEVPLYVQVAGFLVLCLGSWIVGLTFKENSYAAPVIKIQKERAHHVVTTGPYAYVRHPMYGGALLSMLGTPLLLGSWWGLAAGAVITVLIGMRAVFEEETLKAELEGYAEYAARVRYRLVPLVW
jgi:protein-S-isoprenylcysteine O-methyltransferase Ste14